MRTVIIFLILSTLTLAIGTGMFITVGGTGILAKTFKGGARG